MDVRKTECGDRKGAVEEENSEPVRCGAGERKAND